MPAVRKKLLIEFNPNLTHIHHFSYQFFQTSLSHPLKKSFLVYLLPIPTRFHFSTPLSSTFNWKVGIWSTDWQGVGKFQRKT